ncbi:MAG: ATP-dependent sacrificial sulfur transferase LarE [Deltaproteobacteria bacterium]|nr:ATP-dependent sacrificial sulfur transferase LarE [Deltaproteobacteria bacterium]
MDKEPLTSKKGRLVNQLKSAGSLLVAYSGGVDSSFLLALSHETLGDRVVAATAVSEIYPSRDLVEARAFTRERGIQHILFESKVTALAGFVSNGPDRCYHCKKLLFQQLIEIAAEQSLQNVAHGANGDDLQDYRPGLKAAKEMGILSPLSDAGLSKEDVRFLAREMGLPQWDKPPMACLATRIPYESPITVEKLKMIEKAEAFLFDSGIMQCRVRHHGPVARIELDEAGQKAVMDDNLREAIIRKFRNIGFLHVALDLDGYVSGSMNRALRETTELE